MRQIPALSSRSFKDGSVIKVEQFLTNGPGIVRQCRRWREQQPVAIAFAVPHFPRTPRNAWPGGALVLRPAGCAFRSFGRAGRQSGRRRLRRIDVLVNNACFGQLGGFEELPPERAQQQFGTNVFDVTRAVLPVMRIQHSGHVVTNSSACGITGFDGASISCATKFAVSDQFRLLQQPACWPWLRKSFHLKL